MRNVVIAGFVRSPFTLANIRPGTTTAGLAQLKPAFVENGAVTAGTSSPLTDGASAVLICSEEYAMNCGLTPIARIRSVAVAGCAPEVMGIGPVAATRNALRRANLDIEDMDVVELNEAFASQALACVRDLGIRDEILNIDGGAIALIQSGHTTCSTVSFMMTTAFTPSSCGRIAASSGTNSWLTRIISARASCRVNRICCGDRRTLTVCRTAPSIGIAK